MAEIDSLLEEIARHPGDDVLRWRAASMYERQGGQVRSRFIRLQLQIASLPEGIDSPEWLPMIEESVRILRTYYRKWNGPYEHLRIEGPEYYRGFIEGVYIRGWDLMRNRGELFRSLPIQHVDLLSLNETSLEEVLGIPEMQRIVTLALGRLGLENRDVESFREVRLPNLRWLGLAGNNLDFQVVERLGSFWRKSLPALEFVELTGNRYDPADEIDYDQQVALSWRRGGDSRFDIELDERVPWLRPRLVDGRVEPMDRMALGRVVRSVEE
jgi:hypothetical protein